eukprot:TRINITY_DN8049_c0_g1_i1.p1 TRINITY_DN8049_c0_g1~~TRINITY_DN8049_c0_g1_i1.p1  ORF type:complete len:2404 (-),score=554.15 TRINITY_DN8049_c0_g1_i1:64-6402(-)
MEKQRELDTTNNNLPPPNSNAVLLTLKLGSVSLSLRKDGANFFQVSINDLMAKVIVDRNMVVHVSGRLGHVRGRDLQLTGPWSDILSIGEKPDSPNKTPALTFSLDYFDPKMPNWPGHEVVLTASVATLRFVVLMRLLSELEVYFSAFLKMYTLLGYVPNPEDTIVKLDVSIANPLIIVPRSSSEEEHVLVDLGKISVKNHLDYAPAAASSDVPIVSKDNITVQIIALNLKTFVNVGGQKLSEAKFVDNIDLTLSVARNLIRAPTEPEILVSASLPRFSLEIASERLLFFASLLGGNFSELPLRADEDELRLVIEFLQSVNSSLLLPADSGSSSQPQEKPNPAKPPAPVARVDFQLQQISITLLSGSGSTYDGISTSLIRFAMKNLGLKVATEADGSMELMVNLASVSLEDTRQASKNQYKMILGSYAAPSAAGSRKTVSAPADTPSKLGKSSSENEISLQLVSLPSNSLQVVTIEMTRPRIYIVPTQLESLFEFALPLIKQALRAQEVFATRSRFEAAAAQRRSTFLQEGNLKQKQETEYQRLISEQQQEYRKAEARLQLLRASSLTATLEEEQKLVDALNELKQTHTRKLRALKATHQAQTNEYRAISSQLAAAAEKEMAKARAQRDNKDAETATESPPEFKEQKIRFLLRSPEICLLKNPESSTTAFVVHLGDSVANVTLRNPDPARPKDPIKDEVDFQLISFDVFKAEIEPSSGAVSDKLLLLQPFDISFKLENSRADESIIAQVDLSSLNTIISYQDLRLAMNVFETFDPVLKKIQAELEKEKQVIDAVSSTFADAAAQAKSLAARRMSLAPSAATAALKQEQTASSNQSQAVSIRFSKSMLSILNDTNPDFVIPLFKAELGRLDSAIDISSDFLKLTLRAREIAFSAYSTDLSTYEPIIEPWDISALVKRNMKTESVAIRLNTDKTLNLNVGKSLIDAAFNAKSFISELLPVAAPAQAQGKKNDAVVSKASSSSLAAQGRSFSPFVIKNDCHVPLFFWFSGQGQDKAIKVESGEEKAIIVPASKKQDVANETVSKYFLDVKIDSAPLLPTTSSSSASSSVPTLRNIPIDKVHVKPHLASHIDRSLFWVSEVVNRGGTKALTIRTAKLIENNTPVDLEMQVISEGKQPLQTLLKAGDRYCVQLNYTSFKSLLLRPTSKDAKSSWSWFQFDVPAPSVTSSGKLIRCQKADADGLWSASIEFQTPEANTTTASNQKRNALDTIISINPALVIENLLAGDLLIKSSFDKGNNWDFSTGINPGSELAVYDSKKLDPTALTLAFQVGGFYWSENFDLAAILNSHPRPYNKAPIKIKHTSNTSLNLYADISEPHPGAIHVTVYASQWIVNQTGLPLAYRTSSRGTTLGGDDNRNPVDLRADPRTWYKEKDKFLSQIAAQKFYYSAEELGFQIADGPWSPQLKVELDKEKSEITETVEVKDPKLNRIYSFLVTVTVAPGRFWRTNEIRIRPSFIIVNETKRTILYTHAKSSFAGELPAGEQIPFHWSDVKLDKVMQINFANTDTFWSGSFRINQIDNFMVKIRPRQKMEGHQYDLVNVSLKVRDGVNYVVLRPGEDNYLKLYTIENQTTETLVVKQKGVDYAEIIGPKSTADFFWDEPHQPQAKFVVLGLANEPKASTTQVDPNTEPKLLPDWDTKGSAKQKFKMALVSKGFTRSVLVYDARESQSAAVLSLLKAESVSRQDQIELEAQLGAVSISVIDNSPAELLYVSFKDIILRVMKTDVDVTVEAGIQALQIDNQMYLCPEPVLLTLAEDADPQKRMLNAKVILDTREPKIVFIKQLAVLLAPLELNLDQGLILRAAITAELLAKYLVGKTSDVNAAVLKQEAVLPLLPAEDVAVDNYYFQQISIETLKSVLSLRKGEPVRITGELTATQSTVKRVLETVLNVSSIEKADLTLQAFQLKNTHCSMQDFQVRIAKHYTSAALSQLSGLIFNYFTKSVRGLFRGQKRRPAPARPPRYFPTDNAIVPYDLEKSLGQKILRSLRIRDLQDDHYVAHFPVSATQTLVFGSSNLVLVEANETVNWRAKVTDVLAVQQDSLTIKTFVITVKDGKPAQVERVCKCGSIEQVEQIKQRLEMIVQVNKDELAASPLLSRVS